MMPPLRSKRLVPFTALVLLLAACGASEGEVSKTTSAQPIASTAPTTTTTIAATTTTTTTTPPTTTSALVLAEFEECLEINTPLIQALDAMHLELDGGISFGDYTSFMQSAQLAVEDSMLPPELFESTCRHDVNDVLARAWKIHLTTWGTWSDCLDDASCDTQTLEPAQAWEEAADLLFSAIDGLAAMAPEGWDGS